MNWQLSPIGDFDRLGYLPQFLHPWNPARAVEQIDAAYAMHGGWMDFEGFDLKVDDTDGTMSLHYPEDPPRREIGRTTLRDQTVVLFESDWVAVIEDDGKFRVARID